MEGSWNRCTRWTGALDEPVHQWTSAPVHLPAEPVHQCIHQLNQWIGACTSEPVNQCTSWTSAPAEPMNQCMHQWTSAWPIASGPAGPVLAGPVFTVIFKTAHAQIMIMSNTLGAALATCRRFARIRHTHFLRQAIAGTRTSARPQQQAVSPIQRYRMISPEWHISKWTKGFRSAHLGKRKLCPRFSQRQWLHCMAKRGLKDVTSFN